MTDEERKVMQMALDVLSPDPYKAEWVVAMDMDKAIKAIQKCLANDALDRKAENARELGLSYEPVAFINVEQRKLEWAKYMSWDTPTVVNLPKIPLYTKDQL